jgi:PAS domain S-box-containing protein
VLARRREQASSQAARSSAREDWWRAPEEQLRRLARAFEAVPVGVMFAGADARIELVNEAFCGLTGYSPEELRGGEVAMLRPDDHDPRVYEELMAVLDRGERVVREYPRRRKDGTTYLARVSVSPMFGRDGRVESHVEVHEDVSLQAMAREALEQSEALSRDILRRSFEAQEDERRRLARDLHDGVGQRLTSLLLGLTRLEHSCAASLRDQVCELREQVRATMDEIDVQVRGMHPRALEDFGLAEVVRRMVPEFAELHGLHAALELRAIDRRLPRPVETTLYRVLQEALTNVSRHAEARTLRVCIEADASLVRMRVEDDGQGFDAARLPSAGLGLHSIRERADLHGGSFEVLSSPRGTTLTIQLPLARWSHGGEDSPAPGR